MTPIHLQMWAHFPLHDISDTSTYNTPRRSFQLFRLPNNLKASEGCVIYRTDHEHPIPIPLISRHKKTTKTSARERSDYRFLAARGVLFFYSRTYLRRRVHVDPPPHELTDTLAGVGWSWIPSRECAGHKRQLYRDGRRLLRLPVLHGVSASANRRYSRV